MTFPLSPLVSACTDEFSSPLQAATTVAAIFAERIPLRTA